MLRNISFVRFVALVSLAATLFVSAASAAPGDAPPRPPRRSPTGGRTQFGPQGAGSIAVWTERGVPAIPQEETDEGTSDVVGVDLATNQPLAISAGPGDQTTPAISGPVVVWEDDVQSCPNCERDIRGKDLLAGAEFTVATGPSDQVTPAIAGRSVTWVENDGAHIRLLRMELGSQSVSEISSVSSGTTLGRPVMSDDLTVWAEQSWRGEQVRSVLRAYDHATGNVSVVAESEWIGMEYAVSGRRVVWTDPRLVIADLAAGTTSVLEEGFTTTPAIAEDIIVWSASEPTADDLDIYGLNLNQPGRVQLVSAPGNQLNPAITDGWIVWQSDEDIRGRVNRMPLARLFAEAGGRQQTQQRGTFEKFATSSSKGGSRPAYKGMHMALGPTSWGQAAVDALGAPNAPYFGSFVVLTTELGFATGRGAPWGPTVADAMRGLQSTYGTRVIVRTWPTLSPKADGTVNPSDVTQQVLKLAAERDWVRHVQINNEPNLEWPAQCINCTWGTGSRTYTWSNRDDSEFYNAINEFYSDVWWEINYWKTNHPDAVIRTRLQNMEIWTPPMADFYKFTGDRSFYVPLQGMIDLYDRMAYHTYPAPNYDADGAGGVKNNSWPFFSPWVQTSINNGSVRSIITEFGWNPPQMRLCGMAQNKTWPAGSAPCGANDGYSHTVDNDIKRFLANHRYKAEVVAVWVLRGWKDDVDNVERADGIDQSGNLRTWFQNYRRSNP